MTTFCGIQIQGIRSFHPDSPELIELNPPLTVIVGHNGAGKTTIVECLRYVTTGKLPGGTFVHDPRLLQRSEVKAQVRLLFKDEKDNKYLCCRSLSGTATGKGKGTSTISQKSVDGVFAIHNAENEQRSVTMKCSDLDLKVRMLLGVPKTILESVIFCIQEDSNWPLADPATLKKRFDEIFGLDGWKATLDTFNVPEKKLLERQKVTHTQLQYLRNENDMAEQTKQRLQEYQAEESRCEQVSADLDQRIEQVETQIATLENIRDTLKEKEHDKTMLEKSVSSLREHINVLQASDEELNMEFIRYNEEIDKRELRREELRADVERIRNEKQSYENQIMEMERQITRHSMNIENHKQKIAELEQAFNDEAHPLRDTVQIFADTFKSPALISRQKGELVKRKNQIEVFFKQLKAEAHQREQYFGRELRELFTGLNNAKFRRTNLVNEIDKYRQQINNRRTYNRKHQELADELVSLRKKLEKEKEDLDHAEKALKELVATSDEHDQTDSLNELRAAAQVRRARLSKMHSEMEFFNRISRLRDERDQKAAKADRLRNDYKEEFREVQGGMYSESTLIDDINARLKGLDAIQRDLLEKEKNLEDLEMRRQLAKAAEAQVRKHRQDFQRTLSNLAGDMFLGEAILESEREINNAQETLKLISALGTFAGKALEILDTQHACFGCMRPLDDAESEKEFLKRIDKFRASQQTPHFFENKAIIERHTERLRELRSLTLWDERLQREEEEFQSEYNLDDLETNVSQLKSEVQNLHTDLNNLEDLSNLKKTAENMLGLEAEVEQLSKEIMTSEINLADSGSVSDPVRTTSELQEIEQDINKIQDENVKIQKMKITKMQQVSQYTKICQSLQDQITEKERYLKDATEKMTLAEEAEASSKRAQREKEEVDKQIVQLEEQERKLNQEANAFREKTKSKEENYNKMLQQISTCLEKLAAAEHEYERFQHENDEQQMEELKTGIKDVQLHSEQKSANERAVQHEIDFFESQFVEVSKHKINVERNIELRRTLRDLETINNQIAGIRNEICNQFGDSADPYRDLKTVRDSYMKERSKNAGRLQTIKENIAQGQNDIRDRYMNTAENYKAAKIEDIIIKTRLEDLKRLKTELETGLLTAHAKQMDRINKVIADLWRKTYRGDDIDFIAIKADAEGKAARSFNYRVSKVKGSVEISMKEGSSAGQRALASIIIRLALAEAFAGHCGALVLDEPTANLDIENTESLATSLGTIIRDRRYERPNFQLIVVTHNKNFVRMLGANSLSDTYVLVDKDYNQYSRISVNPIGLI